MKQEEGSAQAKQRQKEQDELNSSPPLDPAFAELRERLGLL